MANQLFYSLVADLMKAAVSEKAIALQIGAADLPLVATCVMVAHLHELEEGRVAAHQAHSDAAQGAHYLEVEMPLLVTIPDPGGRRPAATVDEALQGLDDRHPLLATILAHQKGSESLPLPGQDMNVHDPLLCQKVHEGLRVLVRGVATDVNRGEKYLVTGHGAADLPHLPNQMIEWVHRVLAPQHVLPLTHRHGHNMKFVLLLLRPPTVRGLHPEPQTYHAALLAGNRLLLKGQPGVLFRLDLPVDLQGLVQANSRPQTASSPGAQNGTQISRPPSHPQAFNKPQSVTPPSGPSVVAPPTAPQNRGPNISLLSAPTRPRGGPPPAAPRDGSAPRDGPWAGPGRYTSPPSHQKPPTGPRVSSSSNYEAQRPPPFRHSSSSSTPYPRAQRSTNYLSGLPAILPGGKPLPSGLDPGRERRLAQLETDKEKLLEQIEEKQRIKRAGLREWERLSREASTGALKSELAEAHLQRMTEGDGLGGGAAF
ncbi:hypothetical protein FQN50_002182 [Emmonsiellopsis sp. PD_5]|nr:hypothetical protein FQN50_002182 [Emmonsiellopsis sp. PD_5]